MTDRELLELLLHKVSSIETDVSTLKSDVSTLKSDVSTLKSDVKAIDAKVNIIFEQTAMLTEYHEETTAKLNKIIGDQKSTHEILGEHEVAIRTLRRQAV